MLRLYEVVSAPAAAAYLLVGILYGLQYRPCGILRRNFHASILYSSPDEMKPTRFSSPDELVVSRLFLKSKLLP